MKILIAYDGSSCADAALRDLKRAGLPPKADSTILTIADVWPPPPPGTDDDDLAYLDQRVHARLLELREAAKSMLAEAASKAEQAARIVQSSFPGWSVRSEALADSPAWGILKRASEWPADLIVVGSHGMSVTDRLFIGSVSQRVIAHASCSVRVARERTDADPAPVRLIIGFDGSADADAAVREVASRSWPENTEVRLLTAVDHRLMSAIAARILRPRLKPEETNDYQAELSKMADDAAEQLRAARLSATCTIAVGEPKRVLLEAAEQWPADCVFLGATGLRGLRRLLLGSVSSAVSAHAPCTVEIVRAR